MNLDWLNSNSLRNFPIKDDLGRVSVDGLFVIPNSLIVDMALCSSQLGNTPNLYISGISCSSTSITVEISANGVGVFGTFQTSLPLSDYNIDVSLVANDNFPSATGLITFGSSDDLTSLPYGDFQFTIDQTALLMRVYSPNSPGLSWISFSDAKGNSSIFTGYVQIQGNSNIQFRNESGIIYVDAGEGLGLNKICATPPQPILTINGVSPDSSGNFTLIADTCVSITEAQAGVLISNPCGDPCLGCSAITALTTQVNELESSILDIKNFSNNLQTVITQVTNLLSVTSSCS